MHNYVLDSSAVVEYYLPSSPASVKLLQRCVDDQQNRKAILYLPNFCIPEVFNAFARKFYLDKHLKKDEYDKLLKDFRKDLRWGATFYAYELNRYHVLAADEVIAFHHELSPQQGRKPLSTFDILVIAASCELIWLNGSDNVTLVTGDKRMAIVCEELRKVSPERREAKHLPDREIKWPSRGRWEFPRTRLLGSSETS